MFICVRRELYELFLAETRLTVYRQCPVPRSVSLAALNRLLVSYCLGERLSVAPPASLLYSTKWSGIGLPGASAGSSWAGSSGRELREDSFREIAWKMASARGLSRKDVRVLDSRK